MTLFHHTVTAKEQNIRIDKLLSDIYKNASRSQIQKWINDGYVTVNGQEIKSNYKGQENDYIQIEIPKEQKVIVQPENIPLSIIYEDKDILIVNKPKGMVVHPSNNHHSETLVNGLLYYTDQLSQMGGEERPGIVHRLDKDTSGLLIVAKNDESHLILVNQFKENKVERFYEAIVHGIMKHNKGIIDAPIGRDPNNRINMTVLDSGKQAITAFEVINRYHSYTHIECQLHTGRTHQIRVHMNYIGHPIVGDEKYGVNRVDLIKGQVLFAKKLIFRHPRTNKLMTFEIDQPDHFKKVLYKIEKLS